MDEIYGILLMLVIPMLAVVFIGIWATTRP